MIEKPIDIAIVGAGAAGLMSAVWAGKTASENHFPLQLVLIDTRKKFGAKILMSGGNRCNVTNQSVRPEDYCGGPAHFIKHVLEAFTPRETIQFFKDIGVGLVLEPGGKYFPASGSAQTVLDALVKKTSALPIILKTDFRIAQITKKDGLFYLINSDGTPQIPARKVILATGGLSFPATGSDGQGQKIAKSFGHTVIDPSPALTPLLTNDRGWKSLSGLSIDVSLSFFKNGKKQCSVRNALLFTHFGFSGPAALDISRHLATAKEEGSQIIANFLPNHDEETLKIKFQSAQKKNPSKLIKNFLCDDFRFPARFVEMFLKKIDVDGNISIGKCPGEKRKRLVRLLLQYPLEVTGVCGFDKAEVTAGGVDLKEVNVSTMESKYAAGLYFAGEILDADGRIGGFNFQWAWSTGAIAGRSAAVACMGHLAEK